MSLAVNKAAKTEVEKKSSDLVRSNGNLKDGYFSESLS